MARPRMIVIAGPPSTGKTRGFPASGFGVDGFNIDDRCAQRPRRRRARPEHDAAVGVDEGVAFVNA